MFSVQLLVQYVTNCIACIYMCSEQGYGLLASHLYILYRNRDDLLLPTMIYKSSNLYIILDNQLHVMQAVIMNYINNYVQTYACNPRIPWVLFQSLLQALSVYNGRRAFSVTHVHPCIHPSICFPMCTFIGRSICVSWTHLQFYFSCSVNVS